MHVGKQFTRMAGVRPHQPRSPARPSALVRTNAHGRQTRTPVRSYDARDCREEGSEIGFPSHTAMSRSAPTEVLLAVLGAHQTDTLWCSNMCLRGVCQRTWLTVCICKRSACPPGPCLLRRGHPPCSRGGNATRLGHVKSADTPCARPQKDKAVGTRPRREGQPQ